RDKLVTGVQTCALPICPAWHSGRRGRGRPTAVPGTRAGTGADHDRRARRAVAGGRRLVNRATLLKEVSARLGNRRLVWAGIRGEIGRASCRERGEIRVV